MKHFLFSLVVSLSLAATAVQADQIIISEIMCNPSGTKAEYIEIKNVSYNARDIVLWKLTDGVTYQFPDFNAGAAQNAFIKARERIIISSKDAATTRSEYGLSSQTRVFGPWTGSLANEGERITLEDKNGVVIATVDYKEGGRWPKAADGTGHSLMIVNENCDPDDWHNWKASPQVKGGAGSTLTVINYTDVWKWNIPDTDPGTAWRGESFNDGGWGSGPGMLGYEGGVPAGLPPLQTAVGNNGLDRDVYLFRKTFTYNGAINGATVAIDSIADDGVSYYLNGNLLGSVNHTPGAWNNNANSGIEASEQINAVIGPATGLHSGTNVLAAEVHQTNSPNSDMLFAASLRITGGASSIPTVRLSEVHFHSTTGNVDWVEIQNTGGSSQDVSDLFLATQNDLSDKVALSGNVAGNGFASYAVNFAHNGKVTVYLADSNNNILSAVELERIAGRDSMQAVWPVLPSSKPTWELLKVLPEWFSSTTATQSSANNPSINTGIVISEIMNDPMGEQTGAEYLELFNKGVASVNLTGWKLQGGVDFDFPAGTSIAPGGYLVVGSNKAYLQSVYPTATVVGNWEGKLGNKGDYLRLEDSNNNLADEVDFHTGGDWPDLSTNKGSSLELINPNMDNNRASAWRASDESNKSGFSTYTFTGTYLDRFDGGGFGNYTDRPAFTGNPSDYKEWHFFGVKDGHIILKNISLQPQGGGSNLLQNVGQMSNNGKSDTGWLAQGTQGQSFMSSGELHLVSDGHGDGTTGKVEIDCTGINAGSNYTISFDAKWVAGTPVIMGQMWDRSMGSPFRISVPDNLGTPGLQNSRFNGNAPPQVDSIIHSPAVPTASQSVKITARVYSVAGLGSVEARVRQDDINQGYNDNNYASTTMVDNGTAGDAVAGDGVYTATVSNQADGRMVQFYVRATASNGQTAVDPPLGNLRPAMWRVDDLTKVDTHAYSGSTPYPRSVMGLSNLRRQRFIISDYDIEGMRSSGEPTYGAATAKYQYRYPRMSNHYFPATFINNETDVYYLCEARQSGSRWHRSQDMAVFDNIKWKIPDDRLFRKHEKLYTDTDCQNKSGLANHLSLYLAYLCGYNAVNEIELVRLSINGYAVQVRSETELTDNDLVARTFENGGDGQLIKCAEQLTLRDDNVDAYWPSTNYTYDYRGTDNPVRWHGSFPLRSREWEFDYSSFTDLFKTWSNTNSSREQLERIIDAEQFFMMAAVRGFSGDWDSMAAQGKNGVFYRRPSDGRWTSLHWDGDASFELNANGNFVFNGFPGLGEFASRPWNRRIFNYYLTELLQKWGKGSARTSAWLSAQQSAVSGAFVYGAQDNFPSQYTTFFNNHESYVLEVINQNHGSGGSGGAHWASFAVTTPGGSTTNATINLTGTAPSSAYSVVIDSHPEATFTWTNQVGWTLSGVILRTGSNNLTLRMIDREGAQIGTALNWSITKTGNAAPVMKLNVDPGSYNVTLGQVLTLDASASMDPDNSPFTLNWSHNFPGGVTVTTPLATPANSIRHAVFTTPGIYSFTVTGNDGTNSASLSREFAVANYEDFEPFTIPVLNTTLWTASGIQIKSSTFPSRWYSLNDKPGSLIMHVMESSAKPLNAGGYPTITRTMPPNVDCAILTDVSLETRKTGTFFTGLFLETSDGKYVFGLNNGTQITARRSTGGNYSDLVNSPQTFTGSDADAKLRIRRVGSNLQFDRRIGGIWSNLFTRDIGASTLIKGGVFLSTENAESARAAFDYVMVVDPGNQPDSVLSSLRITEVMYNPRDPDSVEYIELRNIGGSSINVNGVHIDDGDPVDGCVIGNVNLATGAFGVLTNNTAAFQAKYPGVAVLAQWTSGALNNGGEKIILRDASNNIVHNFSYSDASPWPTAADGTGAALEVISTSGDYNDPANWRSTPGAPGAGADTDGDGIPDTWEAKFGTSASDPLSKPRTTTSVNGSNQTQISWGGVSGQNYRVEYCDNLGSTWETLSGAGSVAGISGTVSFTDPQIPRPAKRFYRITAL